MKTSHKGIGKKIVIAVVSIFSLAATAQEDKTWRFGGQWGFHGNQSHYNGGMEQANARFEQQPFGGVSLSLLARYDYNKRWMFTSGLGIATFGFNFSISENYSLRQGRSLLPITNEFGVIEIPTMAYYKFTPNCRGSKLVIGAGIVQTLIGEQSSTKTYLNAEGNTNANYLKSENVAKDGLVNMIRFSFGHEKVLKKGGIMSVNMIFNLGLKEIASTNVTYRIDGQDYQHIFSNTGNFIGFRMTYFLRPLGKSKITK